MSTIQTMVGEETTLAAIRQGEIAQVHTLYGGHAFVSRLAALGFTPGTRLQIVQNFGRGPLIVAVRDTRVALGRGEAERVLVTRLA